MYNRLIRGQLERPLADIDALINTLQRLRESGTWMDCSETNEQEVEAILAAVVPVRVLLNMTLAAYFVE